MVLEGAGQGATVGVDDPRKYFAQRLCSTYRIHLFIQNVDSLSQPLVMSSLASTNNIGYHVATLKFSARLVHPCRGR